MGCASFTAFIVAMVQKPVDGSLQPIENSPPGIHTMPSGALLGRGSWLGTVGAKADPPFARARSSAEAAGESHATLKTTSVNVPNKKGTVKCAFVKVMIVKARRVGGKSSEPSLVLQLPPGYGT